MTCVFYEHVRVMRESAKLATATTRGRFLPDLSVLIIEHSASATAKYSVKVPPSERRCCFVSSSAAATREAVAAANGWRDRVEAMAIETARNT